MGDDARLPIKDCLKKKKRLEFDSKIFVNDFMWKWLDLHNLSIS